MTLSEMLDLLNDDLKNEYKHMLFYMHAANVVVGMERFFLAGKLKDHAAGEMGHVFEFAHKIRGKGRRPVSGLEANDFPHDVIQSPKEIINYALLMEQEVIVNYHQRHAQATQLYAETNQHYDIIIFLEEQIEDSQHDVDELLQVKLAWE